MSKIAGRKSRRLVCLIYLPILAALAAISLFLQPGVYGGLVQGHIMIVSSSGAFSSVNFKATAPATWHWTRPRSITYEQVAAKVFSEKESSVQIDLLKSRWTTADQSGPLDESSLRLVLFQGQQISDTDVDLNAGIRAFMHFLDQLKDGSLPGPRHHTYTTQKPIQGSFNHFSGGSNYGLFGLFGWLLLWPVYLLLPSGASSHAGLTPRWAFVLTLAFVALVDAVAIGVAHLFSPSGISEAMEFVIGMTNLPTYLILGDRAVFSPLGYAFGAIAWATIVSIFVLLRRPGERNPEES